MHRAPKNDAEFITRCNAIREGQERCNRLLGYADLLEELADRTLPIPKFIIEGSKNFLPEKVHYVLREDVLSDEQLFGRLVTEEAIKARVRSDDAWDEFVEAGEDGLEHIFEYRPTTAEGKIAGLRALLEARGVDGIRDDDFNVSITQWGREIDGSPQRPRIDRKAA